MFDMNHKFFMPVRLHFGRGCLDELGEIELPGKKALIVITNESWIIDQGHLARISALLKKAGAESVVFNKVHPNPSKDQVAEGAALCNQEHCDMVVAFGGGSSIDTAKSIAVLAANGGDFWDYVDTGSGKGLSISKKPLPIIAIPTSAGTGSEADPWVVVTKEETNEKLGFGSPSMFAYAAFIDAEVMVSVPPRLTAFQGFDALFHAMEGYIANVATPISDLFALKSMSLIGKSIIKAVSDGKDIDAREDIALASTCSGIVEAISDCTGNHSIAQTMGAYHDIPHGAALLATSIEYFKSFEKIIPQKYSEMASAFSGGKYCQPEDMVRLLEEYEKTCGVYGIKLSEYGFTREELPIICDSAFDMQYFMIAHEPKPLTREEMLHILEVSYR